MFMTMTLHRVSGADGYDYLTGQVAAGDTRGLHPDAYLTLTGERPGYWLGTGTAALGVSGTVGTDQMKDIWVTAAKRRTQRSTAVAGWDLTFSPPKSVSVYWALAPDGERNVIEECHRAAVAETIAYLERDATFTRTGHAGANRVPAEGLVVSAFEHRASRAGDPDLHTHAAVLNNVQGPDGKWRTVDARAFFAAKVTASETYNARLEDQLTARLGVTFTDVPRPNPRLRPVREITGVPAPLLAVFSSRRGAIEERHRTLAAEYETKHGLDSSRSVGLASSLYQRATLETRPAKPAALTLRDRLESWRAAAVRILGLGGIERMLQAVHTAAPQPDPRTLDQVARDVYSRVTRDRPQLRAQRVRSEVERQLRAHPEATGQNRIKAVDTVQEAVMAMQTPQPAANRPAELAALGARIRQENRTRLALTAAQDFFTACRPRSWVPNYLHSRGLRSHSPVGYAPGRTAMVDHLRIKGFTDQELLTAGLAGRTERGVMYDYFRNRMTVPYTDTTGQVLGFMARKPPSDDNTRNPRYLNSPERPAFHKGERFIGLDQTAIEGLREGATLVICEGPLDALAVNQSVPDAIALSLGGTALTAEHLAELAKIRPPGDVVLALDNDQAGRSAAVRALPALAAAGVDHPTWVPLPEKDPALVLQRHGAPALQAAVEHRVPLQDLVVDTILDSWPNPRREIEPRVLALREAAPVVATMPPDQMVRQTSRMSDRLQLDLVDVLNTVSEARPLPPPPVQPQPQRATYSQTVQVEVSQATAVGWD